MINYTLDSITIHNEKLRPLIKEKYTKEELAELREALQPALEITLTETGFLKAAERQLEDAHDPTHYDAVWVRDSLWAYLGLMTDERTQLKALTILRRMLDYFGSESQLNRLRRVIDRPVLVNDPSLGAMNVLHIRFDSKSLDFEDVFVNGRPQKWNHKQNDALGLFYLCTMKALVERKIRAELLSPLQWECLISLPTYFEKIRFFEMEDSGAWEEIERVNTSSVALVTSALEYVQEHATSGPVWEALNKNAKLLEIDHSKETIFNGKLPTLIKAGYKTIFEQLPGGESPHYPNDNLKYRNSDAALLNLIYPCQLKQLTLEHKQTILNHIEPLIGPIGIHRYLGDAYQSGNYWKQEAEADSELDERTNDCSTEEAFKGRTDKMIPGTEAQWFFDSWLSKIYGELYSETQNKEYLEKQLGFFNRALGQLTGGTDKVPPQGADDKPVLPFNFPESYNTIVNADEKSYAPSPITPLNWAKACVILALDQIKSQLD